MMLAEPEKVCTRGNFHRPYAIKKTSWAKPYNGYRLLDWLTIIVPESDPEYLRGAEAGEFCVVDVVSREKAYFELPEQITPDMITGMASSHFDSTAFRVGPRLWFV